MKKSNHVVQPTTTDLNYGTFRRHTPAGASLPIYHVQLLHQQQGQQHSPNSGSTTGAAPFGPTPGDYRRHSTLGVDLGSDAASGGDSANGYGATDLDALAGDSTDEPDGIRGFDVS